MNNQRGQITVDFIFAIVLVLGFTALLFIMSFTMSMASVAQYITYSSARNYQEAHLDLTTQQARGQAKYQELISSPVFKPIFSGGWFKIDAEAVIGDQTQTISDYAQAANGENDFWGVGTHFVAPILDFQIPFFGSTTSDGNGGAGFTTYIGSYLGREPSADECLKFTEQRWQAILGLQVQSAAAYNNAPNSAYISMADDGC